MSTLMYVVIIIVARLGVFIFVVTEDTRLPSRFVLLGVGSGSEREERALLAFCCLISLCSPCWSCPGYRTRRDFGGKNLFMVAVRGCAEHTAVLRFSLPRLRFCSGGSRRRRQAVRCRSSGAAALTAGFLSACCVCVLLDPCGSRERTPRRQAGRLSELGRSARDVC
jgi:hypothetical protein